MSENEIQNNELTKDDMYVFLDALCKFDAIKIPDDYTSDEVRQAIMELSQERKGKKNTDK